MHAYEINLQPPEIPIITYGTYEPTILICENATNLIFNSANFHQVGSVVNVYCCFSYIHIDASKFATFTITLPIQIPDFTFSNQLIGTGTQIDFSNLSGVTLAAIPQSSKAVIVCSKVAINNSYVSVNMTFSYNVLI